MKRSLEIHGNPSIFKDYSFIPIGWAIDGTSAPDAKETITSTNKVDVRKFAGDGTKDVFIPWEVPPDLSGTTIQYRVIFFITEAAAPDNKGVAFYLGGASIGNGDALGATLGTAVKSSITARSDAQYDRLATDWSDPVTITNLLAGETAIFTLYRKHDDADDTYEQKIGVFGIEIKFARALSAT